jgi:hypothetical protein
MWQDLKNARVATNLIPESILARYRPSPRHGKEAYFSSKENMIKPVLSLNSKLKNFIFPVLAFYIYIMFFLVSFLLLTDASMINLLVIFKIRN